MAPDTKTETKTLDVAVPYRLSEDQYRLLRFLVKSGHKPCQGIGIIGWQDGGKTALICLCVRKRAALLEPKLEQHRKQLAAQVKHLKRWDVRLKAWLLDRFLKVTARVKLWLLSRQA